MLRRCRPTLSDPGRPRHGFTAGNRLPALPPCSRGWRSACPGSQGWGLSRSAPCWTGVAVLWFEAPGAGAEQWLVKDLPDACPIKVPGNWLPAAAYPGLRPVTDVPIYTNIKYLSLRPTAVPAENPTGCYSREFTVAADWLAEGRPDHLRRGGQRVSPLLQRPLGRLLQDSRAANSI